MADKDLSFEDLMSQMGVERLDGKRKAPSKRPREAAVAQRSQPAPTTPKSVSEPRPPERAAPEDEGTRPEPPRQAEPPGQQDNARIAVLAARVASLEYENAELKAHLAASTALVAPKEPAGRVRQALDARGIKGADEARYLLSALVDARLVDGFLSHLAPAEDGRLTAFVVDRVLLWCGEETCPRLPGRAVVQVPKSRCDVCAGVDIEVARRRFQDACLVNGYTVVGLVGGLGRDQQLLERVAGHHRLSMRVFASEEAAVEAKVKLIVAWNGESDRESMVPRVSSKAASVGELLRDVAGALLD